MQVPIENPVTSSAVDPAPEPQRPLSEAAQRALAEAQSRREKHAAANVAAATGTAAVEVGGRAGPDPIRYGDWENAGIASDF